MNSAQEKAALSLTAALKKIVSADLSLYVFEATVYVVPSDIDPHSHSSTIEACDIFGENVTPAGLRADGGAGD